MKDQNVYDLRRLTVAIITLLALLFLSACTMGPDYVKPEVDISNEWRIKPENSKAMNYKRLLELVILLKLTL